MTSGGDQRSNVLRLILPACIEIFSWGEKCKCPRLKNYQQLCAHFSIFWGFHVRYSEAFLAILQQ
jgi:hypothetical protein